MVKNTGKGVRGMNKNYYCEILENIKITNKINKIIIKRPQELKNIYSGQFFNIKCGEGNYPLLRRPISIASVEEDKLVFYINKVGEGTKLLCKREKGEKIDLLGPLGNGFNLNFEGNKVLIIGGGIGIAPLLQLAKELYHRKKDITAMLGYRDEAFMLDEIKKFTSNIIVASENNGGFQHKGYITDLLDKEINMEDYDFIFSCGPEPMLKIIKEKAESKGVRLQLLMEERMACGMGACLVCTCKIKEKNNEWNYVRTCKDGPVFYGNEVIFDE